MDLTIREITAACSGRLIPGEGTDIDMCVSGVSLDSREVSEDGVFIAVPGERVNGHKFVGQVFSKGAALAVVQETPEEIQCRTGEDARGWRSLLLVQDTLQALKDIAETYRKKLSIPVVGITGSAGKTSTKELIASVLAEKYRVLKTEGNFNNEIGVPLTLLRIRRDTEVAVVEMGISDFGEMHRLSKMARPDICVITNIGQSHLKDLKSRDGILKAKSEIFDFMAPKGEICLNGEDDKLISLREVKGRRPHFFGLGGNPGQEVIAGDIQSHGLWGSDALIRMPGKEEGFPVRIPLPGRHMVLNAAAAACVAGLLGLTWEQIAEGLAKLSPVSERGDLLRLSRCTVIDDCYNANPASMEAALELLSLADTEKTAILGDMFNLGENSPEYHRQVGICAARAGIHRILCVGEESGHMFRGACDHGQERGRIWHFPTLEALLEALREEPEKYVPQDCTVLVKASHGMEFARVTEALKAL